MAATRGKIQAMSKDMSLIDQVRKETEKKLKPYANWEEFLKPVPMAIATLGDLASIFVGMGYFVKQYPKFGNFKESLSEVTKEGKKALSNTYDNMNQIYADTMSVLNAKEIVQVISKDNEKKQQELLTELRKIKDKGENWLSLAQGAKQMFLKLIFAIQEVLQGCQSDKETYDKKLKEIQTSLQLDGEKKEQIESTQKAKSMEVKAAFSQFIKDLHSSGVVPVLLACLTERNDNNPFNRMKSLFGEIPGYSDWKAYLPIFMWAQQLLSKATDLKKTTAGQTQEDDINKIKNCFECLEVEAQKLHTDKEKAQKISQVGLQICEEMAFQGKEEGKQKAIEKIHTLYQETSEFVRTSSVFWNTLFCSGSGSNMTTDQDDSDQSKIASSTGGGICKLEQGLDKLKVLCNKHSRSYDEIQEQEIMEITLAMESIKQEKDNYENIGKMLSNGLGYLETLKHQWEKVVCFFEMIEFWLTQIKKYLDPVGDIQKISTSDPNLQNYIRASHMASLVYLFCYTYVKVYDKLIYLLEIPGNILKHGNPDPELTKKCKAAQKAIEELMLERKKEIEENFYARI